MEGGCERLAVTVCECVGGRGGQVGVRGEGCVCLCVCVCVCVCVYVCVCVCMWCMCVWCMCVCGVCVCVVYVCVCVCSALEADALPLGQRGGEREKRTIGPVTTH